MAETTPFPSNQVAEPPPPVAVRKGPGRPPSKDGPPQGSIPRVGPDFIAGDEFFDLLSGITTDEWQYRLVYIYRTAPITDRRSTGQLFYLTKYGQAVDQDQIMHDFGSGNYRLLLNETRPGGGKNSTIARCDLSVMNYDYPPKVAPGEWVDDVRNRDWEWCRGKLGPQFQGAPPPADPIDQVIKLRALTDRPEQKDRTLEFVAAITPLIVKLIPEPQKPTPPVKDESLALLITMLMDDRKAMREEISEIRKQNTDAPPQKSWLETALENEDMMRRIFGKGNGAPAGPEGWAGVADKFVDKIGTALTTVAPVIAARMMRPPPGQQNVQPQQQIRPAGIQATAQPLPPGPASAEQPMQPQPQPAPQAATPQPEAAPVPTTEQQQKAMDIWNKYGNSIMQALPFMIDKFQEEFPDGYDCRDWFCNPKRFGNVTWHGLKTEVGIDGFVQIAKQFPDVWMKFQPEDKFREFMADFFTTVGDERPDDFDDDDREDDPDESTSAADSRAPQKASVK